MDQNAWIMLLVGVAISCALFALGVVLYPKLKSEKQGYPFEAEIESALLPFVFQGICSAYRLSEKSMDEIQQRLQGADKKMIAAKVYGMLPRKIGNYELTIVKHYVTEERFQDLVQNAFDGFYDFFEGHQEQFRDHFEKWKAASQSSDVQSESNSARG